MKNLYKIKNNVNSPIKLYIWFSAIGFLVTIICLFFSHGKLLDEIFFCDIRDTGMDFFHSIEYVIERHPYEWFNTLYPPLANLLFYFISRFIPIELTNLWPRDHQLSLGLRGTNLDLRTYQSCMMPFIIFCIVSAIGTYLLLEFSLKENGIFGKIASICMLFSFGMLYAYERGNIIIIVLALLIFYLLFYDSSNKYLKELSLIALAISAGLKLYPVFFGVLLLKKDNLLTILRAILYGITSLICPFFVFHEGLSALPIWIKCVSGFSQIQNEPWIGNSVSNIVYHILYIKNSLTNQETINVDLRLFILILMVMFLIGTFMVEKKWEKTLFILLVIITYSSQSEYIYALFILPIMCFIKEEKSLSKNNSIPFIALIAVTVLLPFGNNLVIKNPYNMWRHMFLSALIIWSAYRIMICILKRIKVNK